jgi:BASS family bile acid:Na+ symporter
MELRQFVMLLLQVSILSTVFALGLKAAPGDLLYLVRRPGLLARSLLAVFVIMPAVTVTLLRLFDFTRTVEIALVALALSPVPPLLPKRESKAGGDSSYALGLMAILALLSILIVPLGLEILQRIFVRELTIAPSAVARVVLIAALLPVAVGMALRAMLPTIAGRLETFATIVGRVLLPVSVVLLLALTHAAIWALMTPGTTLAIAIFVIAGLGIGHVLGGPNPEHSVVLALSTACRHPAIALSIAATNFPDERFGAVILLYLLLNVVIGFPYVAWQRRHAAAVAHTA